MKLNIELITKAIIPFIVSCCFLYLYNDPQRIFGILENNTHKGIVEKAELFPSDTICSFQSIVWAINEEAKNTEKMAKEKIVQTHYKETEHDENKMYLLLIDNTFFMQLNDDKAFFFGNDPRVRQRFNEMASKEPKLLLEEIKNAEEVRNSGSIPNLEAGESWYTISDIRPSKKHIWEAYSGEKRAIKYITDYTSSYQKYLKMNGQPFIASNIKPVEKAR